VTFRRNHDAWIVYMIDTGDLGNKKSIAQRSQNMAAVHSDENYMQRCFDLARQGAGFVSPNPMVGAVLVYQHRIIGEGFHQAYGKAHAEVNAVNAVSSADRRLLSQSTLYVSLEPCCIFGRTPPCTNLILEHQIPKVVISCLDQTPGVSGQGVDALKAGGVDVTVGVLEEQGRRLAQIRNTFVTENRPYVMVKFAQTAQGIFAPNPPRQQWITGPYTRRLVHRWRQQTDAILVGATTAMIDDPALTNRYFRGDQPLRIIVDPAGKVPVDCRVFQDGGATMLMVRKKKDGDYPDTVEQYEINWTEPWIPQLFAILAQKNITHLTVEGGASILNQFLQQNHWDEARVFTGTAEIEAGISAPVIPQARKEEYQIGQDTLRVYQYRQRSVKQGLK